MTGCDIVLPPSFKYHIIEGNAPEIYYVFWSVGSICCLITLAVLIPHIRKIRARGVEMRDKHDEILMPLAYSSVILIVSYPIVLSFSSFFTFLAPISQYMTEFVSSCWEGLCLYFFSRLLIMYLGSLKAMMTAFRNSSPKNYWASPPFGCCLKFCLKPKMMNQKDFRIIYFLIIQYAIIPSVLSFSELFNIYSERESRKYFLGYIDTIAGLVCIYGLFCLMTASEDITHSHDIHSKFFTIKLCVLAVMIPEVIMPFVGITGVSGDDYYTAEVIQNAWSKMISSIVITFVSFRFVKYFTLKECDMAYKKNALKTSRISLLQNDHLNDSSPLVTKQPEDTIDMDHDTNGNDTETDGVNIVVAGSNID